MSYDPNVPGGTDGRTTPAAPAGTGPGGRTGQTGQIKDQAAQEAGEVKDHAAQEARGVRDHAGREATDVKDHAVGEAAAVKDHTADAAQDVAGTARHEARSVVRDARSELRGLVDSSVDELNTQAGTGQKRLAGELRTVVDELGEMADGSEHDGMATHLVREASRRGSGLVDFLENREPRETLDEIRRYAARNPWTFLAAAAGVGLIAGRLARGLKDDDGDDGAAARTGDQRSAAGPAYDSTASYGQGGYAAQPPYGQDTSASGFRPQPSTPTDAGGAAYGQRAPYGTGPAQEYEVPASPTFDETVQDPTSGRGQYPPAPGTDPGGERR